MKVILIDFVSVQIVLVCLTHCELLSGSLELVFAICDVTKYGGGGNKRPSKSTFLHHSADRLLCPSIIWVYLDRLADVGRFNLPLPPHPISSDRVTREHV